MNLKTITDLRIMIILRKVIIMTFPFKQFVMKTISIKTCVNIRQMLCSTGTINRFNLDSALGRIYRLLCMKTEKTPKYCEPGEGGCL